MQPPAAKSIVEPLRLALVQDPKRTLVMAVLAVVMIILWGRALAGGPASARASLNRRSVASVDAVPGTSAPALSSSPVLEWIGQPRRAVSRNLFAIHLDYYAKGSQRGLIVDRSDEAIGSAMPESEQNRQQRILLENLQTQAGQLKLQSTLLGATPNAMVNGQLIGVGDKVGDFTLVRIEARSIFVQQDGATIEVTMH